uniref:Vacuolar protein sorting-associated protein 16 homolog n=1 Tax=Syphacia muris TaxID=451379 RepID=A0A0N5A7L6_9BILA
MFRQNVLFKNISLGCKETSLFAASPYGGPIAVGRYVPVSASYWEIVVKTCAGVVLSTIQFQMRDIHTLYWTRCQRLIVLSKRGHVYIYTPLGQRISTYHFGQEASIVQSRLFNSAHGSTGLAVLLETNFIFVVNSVLDFAPWRLPQVEHGEHPSVWNVLSPNTFGQVTVVSVNLSWKLTDGNYLDACSNWDSSQIAFSHTSLVVQIANSDFSLLYTVTFPEGSLPVASITSSSSASRIYWCGNQAIAVKRTKSSLLVSSMESRQYEFLFVGGVHLELEPDGVKVFTEDELSLITIVPGGIHFFLISNFLFNFEVTDEVENVLGLLSEQCGALLFSASEKFESHSSGVYDYITMIGSNMEKAVQQCLFAAAHQFDCNLQQKLLKAANLGKSLVAHYDSSQFVDTCRVMRVLNNVREPYIGIAMSFAQSTELKMTSLIDRLIDLGHWPLAIKFCKYMKVEPKLGVHRVLAHWAISKIEAAKKRKTAGSTPNYGALAELIVSKFSSFPDVSFADVAMKAVDAGLNDLAVLLLEKETHLDRRVQMLLSLNKIELALRTATKSQQPDLLHIVVGHLRRTLRKDEVDRLLAKFPQALSLYQDMLRDTAPQHALALYKQYDDYARQAIWHLTDAELAPWNPFELKQKVSSLISAKNCVANLKETGLEQVLDESAKLLELSEALEGRSGFDSVDRTSVRSVFIWAYGQKEEDTALIEQMKKKFKVSEKSNMIWRIESYASSGKWHHLENLAKQKKLPIGYMPFIEACARYGNVEFGEQLIDCLSVSEEIVDAYLSLGLPEKAASYAVEKKLTESIDMLYSKFRMDEVRGAEVLRILSAARKA